MVVVGFEFGTQENLDKTEKGIDIATSHKFSQAAHKAGLFVHGCFIIGAPDENKESAEATINLAKSMPINSAQFSGIVVYPGTALYKWAQEKGFITAGDWNEWVTKEGEQATIVSYPQLSKEEIDKLIDKALSEFYFRPRQIITMLRNIKDLGELKNKLLGLTKFVTYLWSRK